MLKHRRFSILSVIVPVLLALTLVFVFSCIEEPAKIDQRPNSNGLSGSGKINPGTSGSFLLGEVSDSLEAPGRIEVWAMNVAFNDSTGIVTFDVKLLNHTHRNILPPLHFVITNIRPDDVAVVDFDGVSKDGFPFYDFSAKLGSDNVLTPGEWSDRVTMKFHTVTARSFAIGFRIGIGPPAGTGTIAGVVFRDDNQDGKRERCDRCEPGIPGITVALESNANSDKVTFITRTDEKGEYKFAGLREGVYSVHVIAPPEDWKITTTNPLLVTLVKGPDGNVEDFLGADFGLFPIAPPQPMNLFGPILIGPHSRFGAELDSTFVNPPSPLTVIFHYYLEVAPPPSMSMRKVTPMRGVVDSASAWINGEMVFDYHRTMPPDTAFFMPRIVQLPDSLVKVGDNTIRLITKGDEHAALLWRVFKKP